MPTVCFRKPNRTKPRPFSVNDLERITRIVEADGVSVFKIIASVAIGLGLGYMICKLEKAIRSVDTLLSIVKQIALVAAVSVAIRAALTFLLSSPLVKLPVINKFAAVIVVVLLLVQKGLDVLTSIGDDLVFLDEVADGLNVACSFVDARLAKMKEDDILDRLSEADRLHAL